MGTILFDEIVFGPVHSRRLGVSLGLNLLPRTGKLCSFDCIYCECGLNDQRRTKDTFPSREEVKQALLQKFSWLRKEGIIPDVFTFAGNGEPTLHPDFGGIIDDTILLRDAYFPSARIAVLSNATMIHKKDVFRALLKIDDNILKLDSVLDERIQQIDVPNNPDFTFEELFENLMRFKGKLIIQTMFLKGEYKGHSVDNTTEEEIQGWLRALRKIRPQMVMIYTIDRETPVKGLKKVSREELDLIASRVKEIGLEVQVSG